MNGHDCPSCGMWVYGDGGGDEVCRDCQRERVLTQQPAEAVSEAAREAGINVYTQSITPQVSYDREWCIEVIQRAITVATATQQAEIAALREENQQLRQRLSHENP